MMIVNRNQPIKAYQIMEAIMEETRLTIIRLLLERKQLTLTEIQKELGKTLATLQFHMNILERAGLVGWKLVKKGKRKLKAYFVRDSLINVNIDIHEFSIANPPRKLKSYVYELAEKIFGEKIPRTLSAELISNKLHIDIHLAVAVKDYIETYPEDFVDALLEVLEKNNVSLEPDPYAVEEKWKIDAYWGIKILKKLKLI